MNLLFSPSYFSFFSKPSDKANSAITSSKWIIPLICKTKNPVAQALTNAKESIMSNFDIIFLKPSKR